MKEKGGQNREEDFDVKNKRTERNFNVKNRVKEETERRRDSREKYWLRTQKK